MTVYNYINERGEFCWDEFYGMRYDGRFVNGYGIIQKIDNGETLFNFVDEKANILFPDEWIYMVISPFKKDGFAVISNDGRYYDIIDRNGKISLDVRIAGVDLNNGDTLFNKCGLLKVCLDRKVMGDSSYTFINKDGKMPFDKKCKHKIFNYLGNIMYPEGDNSVGYAIAQEKTGDDKILLKVDENGIIEVVENEHIPLKFKDAKGFGDSKILCVEKLFRNRFNNYESKYNFLDSEGKLIFRDWFNNVVSMKNGDYMGIKYGKKVLIHKDGTTEDIIVTYGT